MCSAKNAPAILKLAAKRPKMEIKGSPETKGQILYLQNCQSCHTSQLSRSTAGRPFPGRHRVPRRCGPHPVNRDQWFITHAGLFRPLVDRHRFLYFDISGPQALRAFRPTWPLTFPRRPSRLLHPPRMDRIAFAIGRDTGSLLPMMASRSQATPGRTLTAYDWTREPLNGRFPWEKVSELAAKGIKDTGSFFSSRGTGAVTGWGADLFRYGVRFQNAGVRQRHREGSLGTGTTWRSPRRRRRSTRWMGGSMWFRVLTAQNRWAQVMNLRRIGRGAGARLLRVCTTQIKQ